MIDVPLKKYEEKHGAFAKADDDEPVFVLCGHDPAAIPMIRIYHNILTALQQDKHCPHRERKIISCQAEIELFESWQKEQEKEKR